MVATSHHHSMKLVAGQCCYHALSCLAIACAYTYSTDQHWITRNRLWISRPCWMEVYRKLIRISYTYWCFQLKGSRHSDAWRRPLKNSDFQLNNMRSLKFLLLCIWKISLAQVISKYHSVSFNLVCGNDV